eukprot:Hpha_TRINITY_DN16065_c2_g12::TRINITY_DN16065_c2_g12_i1::g.117352::m.117352
MGNCYPVGKKEHNQDSGDVGLLADGQLPRVKPWKSTPPTTAEELNKKRQAYWDTQPAYGGKREIWDALKSVLFDETEPLLASSILQAAEIRFPRGDWSEVYDSAGFRYEIPEYAVSNPTNLAS